MTILLFIAQTLLHCPPLRFIQLPVGKTDPRSSLRQARPLQHLKVIVGEENLPYERAGEERIPTLESVQDKIRTGGFSVGELVFTNGDDGCDLHCWRELSKRSDLNGSAADFLHASFDFALVGIEPDMLYPKRLSPSETQIQ
jgi:hypothetical protein